MTPIPQPSEIAAFIIRCFSRHPMDPSLKKKLQRLSKDTPLSVDAATQLLSENLGDFLEASPNREQVLNGIRHFLNTYIGFVTELDCGALPASDVRRVFDQYAVAMFAEQLHPLLRKNQISITDFLGRPKHGISVIWHAHLKGRKVSDLATELDRKISKQDGTWEKGIRRWMDGQGMKVSTILEITTKVDFDLGFSLLLANAYQEYCCFAPVDVSAHRPPFHFSPEKIQQDIIGLHTGSLAHVGALNAETKRQVERLMGLVDPRARKQAGDASKAEVYIQAIRRNLDGEDRLAGFGVLEGRHQAQMGNLDTALELFEQAAQWFRFRSSVQLKVSLHHLLNTSAALGEKRVRNRWKGWCDALGLDVLPQTTALAFLRDFPNPYIAATNWPSVPENDGSLVILPEWEKRTPDLKHPDRVVKGYGETPSPQLHIFANLGQVEKVRALLGAGADPNKLDKSSGSALLNAIQGGDDACFEVLLAATSPETINATTKAGKFCLHEAIIARRPQWVKSLLTSGTDVGIEGEKGQSPLYTAVSLFVSTEGIARSFASPEFKRAYPPQLPELLRPSSSPFAATQRDILEAKTARFPGLEAAFINLSGVEFGDKDSHREIVNILLDAGADVNAKVAPEGWTPFLYAAEIGNQWLLQTLVEHGATVCDQLADGHTAFTLLYGYQHHELAQWLLREVMVEDRIWLRENGPNGGDCQNGISISAKT